MPAAKPPAALPALAAPLPVDLPMALAEGADEGDGFEPGPSDGAGGVQASAPGGTGASPAAPVTGPSYDAAYLHNPPPRYPAAARRLRLEGTTTLRVLVSPEGHPQRVAIGKSSGIQLLDEAALDAVRHWSFIPARQGDRAIAAEVDVPMRFRLTGEPSG